MMSCQSGDDVLNVLAESGVSKELAAFRSEKYLNVSYNLSFHIPENKEEPVTGVANILWDQGEKLPLIIDFRGDSSQIISVMLNREPVDYSVKNEHIIVPSSSSWSGKNMVSIVFRSSDQSLNRRDEFLYTLLVPDRARTLFPCFDQPDIKAHYSLELTVPESWRAVANGKIEKIDSLSHPGKHIITFQETEPLPTYLFSFVAGKLEKEIFSRGNRDISIYHRETDPTRQKQCPEIARQVLDALDWMEAYTGVPYPFAKYDLVILPGFQYGGMEHTGATLYNDQSMFLNEEPTLDEQLRRSTLIAHETAHMWFGDYVTMQWFNDVWTKEVFANYFAARMVEPVYPTINHRLNFIRSYIPAAYAEDRTDGATPIQQDLDNLRNAGLVYSNIVYDKSPVVLEMLIQRMGADAFQKGIHDYLMTYGYANATWDQLIAILSKYTERDLIHWSQVWVKEPGMPVLQAYVSGDSLHVEESDPRDRGFVWPQQLKYRICEEGTTEDVMLEIGDTDRIQSVKLTHTYDKPSILPNIDGRGYGYFRLGSTDSEAAFACLDTTNDDVLKGSLLITLYENLQHGTLDADYFLKSLLTYLKQEKNDLLYSSALGYVGNTTHFLSETPSWLETGLWQLVAEGKTQGRRLQAFRQFMNLAESKEATDRLYLLWKNKDKRAGFPLSERDEINLSYQLAIRLPEKADEIVEEQLKRISNPDRQAEYRFISPSVSPRKEVRDSVFDALLIADNRRIEPWASTALSLLNHRLREKESVEYIRPALDVLQEVQRTGDIFFPTSWLRSLLGGHSSLQARDEVEAFYAEYPDYPEMLLNKVRQQADHLYRQHPNE